MEESTANKHSIHLRMFTPTQTLFDDMVESVVIPQMDGEALLANAHCNHVGILQRGVIRINPTQTDHSHPEPAKSSQLQWMIQDGVAYFANNQCTILTTTVVENNSELNK